MSQSVKLKNGDYMDTGGIWDASLKKTQEDINKSLKNIVGDNLRRGQYMTTTASTAPHAWTVNIAMQGYTPIMFSIAHTESGSVFLAAEGFDNTLVSGFCSKGGVSVTVYVVYIKTTD